jgi:assimilatory nitrate reductase catalytic subunit
VGLNTIRNAIASGNASDVASIGRTLRAGTNCGSCIPELKKIVDRHEAQDESRTPHPASAH